MKNIKFFDEVHDMQRFVRENINLLGNYLIISEQLYVKNNETGIIDMLAVDFVNRCLTIIELKNELTTDKNIWQPLRYYDLVRRGEDDLRQLLRSAALKHGFNHEEIDIETKLVLVVSECNDQLLRAMSYFNDIDSKVIELKRYVIDGEEFVKTYEHKPTSIFHKDDIVTIQDKVTKEWNFETYKNSGINRDKTKLAEHFANIVKSIFIKKGYQYDIFFSETKATITKNGKVWGYIFIKQKPLDYKLTVSFKLLPDTVIIKNDFIYNPHIEKMEFQGNGEKIKLQLNGLLNSSLIEKHI
ncbi:MAG: hypothetical protein K0R18_232 [Bacillales bacterium]|jgi:hypothetical protein|nr:hypothetical protein [Bacillales bacterium]